MKKVIFKNGNLIDGGDLGVTKMTAPQGDFHVVSRNGKLEALTNHSDYLNMGFWSNHNLSHIRTGAFPQEGSSKGILCSNMTKNNDGASDVQHLRTAEVWNGTENMGAGLPTSVLDVTGSSWKDMYTLMMKYDTTQKYIDWIRPSKGKIRTNETSLIRNELQVAGKNVLYEGYSKTLPIKAPIRITTTSTETTNIPFVKIGHIRNYTSLVIDMNLSALSIPEDEDILITITFDKMDLYTYKRNTGTGKYIIRLITSSSKNFTSTNIFNTGHIPNDTYKTIKLNLETTVKGIKKGTVAPKLFHEPNKQTNNVLYYGCILELEDKNQPLVKDDLVYYNLSGHINITKKTSSALPRTDSRYEYKTLEEISNLQGIDVGTLPPATGFKGIYNGNAPKLKFGKIILMYCMLCPKTPKSFGDFDVTARGIVPSSYNVQNQPSFFLEEQTGTNKFTNRIEFVKHKSISGEMLEYNIECTEEQFKKWKVVGYFHNTLPEAEFKKKSLKFGTSIWFVNSTDVPN